MKLLMWHVDSFRSELTQRGRSKLAEDPPGSAVEMADGLLVFYAVEKADESDPEAVAARATDAIATVALQVGAHAITLHSFAHLFCELSRPSAALDVAARVHEALTTKGHEVHKTPFGWFNTLDIKAKGHPYSRQARSV